MSIIMFLKCTSEDYDNSYDFFLHINENRKDIITAINRLGELLVFYDVEGDVEDWALHVEKVCAEQAHDVRMTSDRCRCDVMTSYRR